jgi:hypothetical protein
MAKWSALAIARARRGAVLRGEHWPWDIPAKIVTKKVPFKGHLRHAQQAERAEEVKRCMARMPAMIEEYRANRPRKARHSGFAQLLAEPRARDATTVGAGGAAVTGMKGKKVKSARA